MHKTIDDKARRKAITAAGIGNFVEWFDFVLYAQFAAIIAIHFFPSENPTSGLLATFAVFALGFLARPIGGVIFGHYGDKHGRKKALSAAVLLMSIATFAIGLTPTFESIGIMAPILLVVWRVCQGLSAGGEYAGSSSFVIEFAPKGKKALYGSINPIATALGIIGGALVGLIMTQLMDPELINSWGWRIPFMIAGPLGIVGLYLRNKVEETPEFQAIQNKVKEEKHAPLVEAFKSSKMNMLTLFGWASLNGLGFYMLTGYMITFMTNTAQMARPQALSVYIVALILFSFSCYFAGKLIDRIGIQKVAIVSALVMSILIVPAFYLLSTGDLTTAIIGLSVFGIVMGFICTVTPLLMVNLFPAHIRYSASALAYNLAYGLLGGTAPYIATYLIAETGNNLAPAYYVVFVTIFGLLITLTGFRFNKANQSEHKELVQSL
ncbi:MAG: MFS transporter [Candidatus Acinetobacter avistercoris]|uniref:MFS transporter n=1 Tax=Acinetobacter sp. KS-LM10 TaxID=3120518 RepID=UPI001F9B3DA4|nr:MFS transporter [Candidatus Acinetobacter avistercoris]